MAITPASAGELVPDGILRPLPTVVQHDPQVCPASMQDPVGIDQQRSQQAEAVAAPMPLQSSAPALSLEQLEEMALANNPAITRAAAQVRALRGKWVQVGLPPNPTIGYVGAEIGNDKAAGQQGGYVGQVYVTGGKLCLNRNIVFQEIRSAEQRLAARQHRVRTDVRLSYYSVLTAQRKLELAKELVDVNSKAVKASQELLEAKEIPRAALLQTRVQLSNASVLQQRAQNQWQASWRQLAAVVGQAASLEPRPLAGDIATLFDPLAWEEQLSRLTIESPEIAEAVAELQRTRWALDRACAEVRPNINTQVSVQFDDSTNDVVTGVQLGIALPIWNRNQGGIRQAQADISAARQNIERVELDLKQRLAEAFQAYSDARVQVENYANDILPKAKEIFDLVGEGYRQGEVGYLDLLAAQRTYSEASLAQIEAQQVLWQSTARIEGLLLDGSLQD
ncbi:MAG: TolC family protein [Planctomycetales bacterium]|nr:TolC family protein [Planctomycetales bacterium]